MVFDGYDNNSTKSNEHERRAAVKSASGIELVNTGIVTTTREAFLKNIGNKQQLINLLDVALKKNGYDTFLSPEEADVHVVQKALDVSRDGVVVAAGDTDILTLIVAHWNDTMGNIYFQTEVGEANIRLLKTLNIKTIAEKTENRDCLLFSHAWSGCDTTSATHQMGKVYIDKKFVSS